MTEQRAGAGTSEASPRRSFLSTDIEQRGQLDRLPFGSFLLPSLMSSPPAICCETKACRPPTTCSAPSPRCQTHCPRSREEPVTYSEPGPQAGSHWKTGKDLSESRISSSSHWVEGKGLGGNLKQKQACSLLPFFLFLCTLETLGPAALSVKGGTPRA